MTNLIDFLGRYHVDTFDTWMKITSSLIVNYIITNDKDLRYKVVGDPTVTDHCFILVQICNYDFQNPNKKE